MKTLRLSINIAWFFITLAGHLIAPYLIVLAALVFVLYSLLGGWWFQQEDTSLTEQTITERNRFSLYNQYIQKIDTSAASTHFKTVEKNNKLQIETTIKEILDQQPTHVNALVAQALLYAYDNNASAAAQTWDQARALDPSNEMFLK